jgi:hypothetical protein
LTPVQLCHGSSLSWRLHASRRKPEGRNQLMTTLDKEKARQGETTKGMRYVLGISLSLAVIAMIIVVLSFA